MLFSDWSQTLPSGEEGHQTNIGKAPANKLLNRFRNIAACKWSCFYYIIMCIVVLKSISWFIERSISLLVSFLFNYYSVSPCFWSAHWSCPITLNNASVFFFKRSCIVSQWISVTGDPLNISWPVNVNRKSESQQV